MGMVITTGRMLRKMSAHNFPLHVQINEENEMEN
jgi:hypothetical protein